METRFSDHKAEHIWEHSCLGMAFVSDDGHFLRVNPFMCAMLGYASVELESKTWKEITHPDDVHADQSMVEAFLRGDITFYTLTKRYLPKVGRPIWIRLHGTRINPQDGDDGVAFFYAQIAPVEVASLIPNTQPEIRPANVDDLARFLAKWWKPMVFVAGIAALAVAKGCQLW